MKRIRIFALVLCVCLLITVFSGCSKEDKLSAKKEKEIKEAYVEFYNDSLPDRTKISIDDVKLRYLGTYSGCIALYIDPNIGEGSDAQSAGYIYIDGYYITTPLNNLYVHVYKNGKFTEIREAYEKGMLTKQDIADMAEGIVTEDGERIPKEFITPNPTN